MIVKFLMKSFFVMGLMSACALGAVLAIWIQEDFPVHPHRRMLGTPVVAAGDDLRFGIDVSRDKNCPISVQRRFTYSNGDISNMYQEIDKEFGPVGRDQYVLRIPTSPSAPRGETKLYSQACAKCNPVQYIPGFEKCGNPIADVFLIGDKTQYTPWPNDFRPRGESAYVTRN